MHPFLFEWSINNQLFRIPTYGFCLAIAFGVAYFLAMKNAKFIQMKVTDVELLFVVTIFISMIGSRMFHVLFEQPEFYFENPLHIFYVWEGGFTFYGALGSALIGMYFFAKIKKISFVQVMDLATPSTTFGLCIGRMGCFFAGCCWGRPTAVPWAVVFRNPEAFCTLRHIPVHPTQLYESFVALCLYVYSSRSLKKHQYPGKTIFTSLIGYGLARYFIEVFRGDDYRGFILGGRLSYAQFISIVLILLSTLGMVLYSNIEKEPQGLKQG